MAENNDNKDQGARNWRGIESEASKTRRGLKEKQERLRIAECNAKGGEYINGRCKGMNK